MSNQNDNENSGNKELKVVFAPGCFDDFEGTQEELDALMKHIRALAASGELERSAEEIPLDVIDDIYDLIATKTAENNRTRH